MSEKGQYYCGHCDEKVSKTLYYAHKKLYYNAESNQWMSSGSSDYRCLGQDTVKKAQLHDNFTFSESDNSESGVQKLRMLNKIGSN